MSASGTQMKQAPASDAVSVSAPPRSASHFGVSVLALIAGLALLAFLQETQPQYSIGNVLGCCALIAGLIAIYDLAVRRVSRRDSTGLAGFSRSRVSPARVGFKLVGLAATLGVLIGGINFIYFMRAKTEEWHLSRDPDYRAYCAWIARHGLWAKLRRLRGSPVG